jgi:hypothetical protein
MDIARDENSRAEGIDRRHFEKNRTGLIFGAGKPKAFNILGGTSVIHMNRRLHMRRLGEKRNDREQKIAGLHEFLTVQ